MRKAMRPPTNEPALNADRINAHAPGPPSDVFEIAAPRTKNGADIMFAADAARTPSQSHVRERTSCHPSSRSRMKDCAGRRWCGGSSSRARKSALTPKVAASTASA